MADFKAITIGNHEFTPEQVEELCQRVGDSFTNKKPAEQVWQDALTPPGATIGREDVESDVEYWVNDQALVYATHEVGRETAAALICWALHKMSIPDSENPTGPSRPRAGA